MQATIRQMWEDLGQFWLAVVLALSIRILSDMATVSPDAPRPSTAQRTLAVASGLMCAWFGTWPIAEHYALSEGYVPIVAGLLALTGREIIGIIIKRGPEVISGVLDAVVSKGLAMFNLAADSWANSRSQNRKGGGDNDAR